MRPARVAIVLLALGAAAQAGGIHGVVVDQDGHRLAGVAVVVTSRDHVAASVVSDDHGAYAIDALAPGDYAITFYYLDIAETSTVPVGTTTVVVDRRFHPSGGGENITVDGHPPPIDTSSTTQGMTIDSRFLENLPLRGRTFDAALGAVAGAQNDALGTGFNGATSLENQYYIDGLNTSDVTFGVVGAPILNNFIDHVDVMSAGYDAEFGRATGGLVNVITKSGTNHYHGSIFATGQLTAPAFATPTNGSAIDIRADGGVQADFGFELGGPIIRDHLWFYVGLAPQFVRTNVLRTTKTDVDCHLVLPGGGLSPCDPAVSTYGGFADGKADVDPQTSLFITEQVDAEHRELTSHTYQAIAKLDFAASPAQQAQVAITAQPNGGTSPELVGPASAGTTYASSVTNAYAKWTSKLDDNRLEIEATLGWYRQTYDQDAIVAEREQTPRQTFYDATLGRLGRVFGESDATLAACTDTGPDGSDRYPYIGNCPITSARAYPTGGPGSLFRNTDERRTARFAVTRRGTLAGNHTLKLGLDIEDNHADKSRLFSGGGSILNEGLAFITTQRWVQLDRDPGPPSPEFDRRCTTALPSGTPGGPRSSSVQSFACAYLSGEPGSPGTQIAEATFNWSGYLQDSWRILPNLTLNAGVRFEEQRLRYASFLRGTVDPSTREPFPKNALVLDNVAPRIGLVYDPTRVGKAKLFAHWGRFFESIPLSINDAAFGGGILYVQEFGRGQCAMSVPALGGSDGTPCLATDNDAEGRQQLLGANGVLVAPGTQAQSIDELVAGVEFEVMDDLRVGVTYQNRRQNHVLDDVSTDGANTFVIGNVGEWSTEEEAKLVDRLARTSDPREQRRLQKQLDSFRGLRRYDPPTRDYNSLAFTLTRRFSRALYLQSSYVYSRTTGNYPGALDPAVGDFYSNTSSQYELLEVRANRDGPLPQDRPHALKLNGFYAIQLAHAIATFGAAFHVFSGIPVGAYANNATVGANQTFLVPRGALGRTEESHGLDLQASYRRKLTAQTALEVFVDIYNVYDHQTVTSIDEVYAPPSRETPMTPGVGGPAITYQNAVPISGGSYTDLIWAKTYDSAGIEEPIPLTRNKNFRQPLARSSPTYVQIGFRLTF